MYRYKFVKCKNNPEHEFSLWVPHMSLIHNQCTCGQQCSYERIEGLYELSQVHYDKYQLDIAIGKGNRRRMFSEEGFNLAVEKLKLDSFSFKVDTFSEL